MTQPPYYLSQDDCTIAGKPPYVDGFWSVAANYYQKVYFLSQAGRYCLSSGSTLSHLQ